ncbi:uncharacterized protein LOC116399491 isoform X2 [Anarrhichthys ocellatus]|uniref:uncharacterized protein LOC116399491 isoform X2 n=1 Tax=Anarrhichthys ocellatus TaxID=433405 RepID=UPI0012ED1253|nr:uncharacterized protein LOC116399491 isoform X2 [Anarrhichthys ocellatus]
MAGLRWMAVVLTVFLSAGDSLAAVDQNWLTSIIEGIKKEYALDGAFSLAVNVPENQDINDLQQVFQSDPADSVKQAVSEGRVYQGTRVVAAARSRAVLENIQTLMASSQGHFLVIYSEDSPCCPTNANDIADQVNAIVQKWNGYAFVFSKVPDVPAADTWRLAESFKQLAISKLGLDNIFRCYEPGHDPFQCTSCSSGGDVTPSCVANDASSNEEQREDEEAREVPATGTDTGKETAPGGGIATGISEGIGGGRGTREGKVRKQSKGRGGDRRGKGSKVRKQSKGRGGDRRGKGSKVRKQSKGRGGDRRGKGSKVRKQSKGRGGGRRGKGSKVRKQSKRGLQ